MPICPCRHEESRPPAHPAAPPAAALWVLTNETGVTWNHAYLHGKVRLARYWAGGNDRGAQLRPTNPLLALLRFGEDGELLQEWAFAGYLPRECQAGGAGEGLGGGS